MKVHFWGVRGSVPIPGPETVRYGGNTSCIEVQGRAGESIVFEAGTGIRCLGLDMVSRPELPRPIHLFVTHTHWDHIQGFPFFVPCYNPSAEIQVYGPVHVPERKTLKSIFDSQMQHEFFPVSNRQLAAGITFEELQEATLRVGGIDLCSRNMNHSIRSIGYRLVEDGRTLVYTGDHEPYYNVFDEGPGAVAAGDDLLFGNIQETVTDATRRFLEFIDRADLLIIDSQYTPDEYPALKRTWGHSSWDYCLEWMIAARVQRMILTHHDPGRSDAALDAIAADVRAAARSRGIDPERIGIAREGLKVSL